MVAVACLGGQGRVLVVAWPRVAGLLQLVRPPQGQQATHVELLPMVGAPLVLMVLPAACLVQLMVLLRLLQTLTVL
jgi:hypothetical protein